MMSAFQIVSLQIELQTGTVELWYCEAIYRQVKKRRDQANRCDDQRDDKHKAVIAHHFEKIATRL